MKLNKWYADSRWRRKCDANQAVKDIKQAEKEATDNLKTTTKIVKEGDWWVVYWKFNRK